MRTGYVRAVIVVGVAWSCGAARADVTSESAVAPGPIEVRVAGQPLRAVAADISKATGLSVSVEPAIADWKATVAFRGEAGALLRGLCDEFKLVEERRNGQGALDLNGDVHYLRLDDEERQRLAKYVDERNRKERERKERDAKALTDRLHAILADKDPEGPHGVEGNGLVIGGAKPMVDLLGSLGPGAMQTLADGLTPNDDGFDFQPGLSVPLSSLDPSQRAMVTKFLNNQIDFLQRGKPAGSSPGADLLRDGLQHLDGGSVTFATMDHDGEITLAARVDFGGMRGRGAGFPLTGAGFPLSRGRKADPKASDAAPQSAVRPAANEEKAAVTVALPDADYGAAALGVAKAAHINVVADFFTLGERLNAFPKDAPLRETLDRLCAAFHTTRQWQGGTLLLREEKWEDRLPEEPTPEALDVAARAAHESRFLTFSEMARVAGMLDRKQLVGFGRWHDGSRGVRPETAELTAHYGLYRWCGGLPEAQLAQLEKGEVRLGSIELAYRARLARLSHPPARPADLAGGATLALKQDTVRYPPIVTLEVRSLRGEVISEIR